MTDTRPWVKRLELTCGRVVTTHEKGDYNGVPRPVGESVLRISSSGVDVCTQAGVDDDGFSIVNREFFPNHRIHSFTVTYTGAGIDAVTPVDGGWSG